MKRIHIILTTLDDMEMLTIKHPMFLGMVCDRFVIEDQRGAMAAKRTADGTAAEAPNKGKPA